MRRSILIFSMAVMASLACVAQGNGQDRNSTEELTKKLSNPVASLISVPIENNMDMGIRNGTGSRDILNFQPVIPMTLTPKINLITRIIAPYITQHDLPADGERQSGLGDVSLSEFFSPSQVKNGLIWGAGPVFLLPTATDHLLGTQKWSAGPTAVILKQTHGWTFGVLASQVWSFAGHKDRADVSLGYLQPFIIHSWQSGAGFELSSEITRNWQGQTTTAFIIPNVTGITKLGAQTIQTKLGPRIAVSAPPGEKADFGLRATVVLIFPK
jgi:hypothetical protein